MSFVVWIFSGFGLVPALYRRHRKSHSMDEIVVHCVHRAFFLWALIVGGFAAGEIIRRWPGSALICGWAYLCLIVGTMFAMIYDINSRKLLLWSGIALSIWIASRYLEDLKHVPVVTSFQEFLREIRPALPPGFPKALSWMLLFPWVASLFQSFSQGRKAFSPNSIEEWYLGDGSELTDRSGLKFRTRYRDLIETLLGFGAGDLEAVDGNGQVVKRWENVLMLWFHWKKLDEILHQRATAVDADVLHATPAA